MKHKAKTINTPHRKRFGVLFRVFFVFAFCFDSLAEPESYLGKVRHFDVSEGNAIVTLREAARQADVEFFYSAEVIRGVHTHSVTGEYEPLEAFSLMLEGTDLTVHQHRENGVYLVTKTEQAELKPENMNTTNSIPKEKKPNRKGVFVALLSVLLPTTSPVLAQDAEEQDAYELSPFVVETTSELGYLATQTLAGTRLKSDIKDVGASLTILTQELMEDLAITDLDSAIDYVASTDQDLDIVADLATGNFVLNTGGARFVSRGGLSGTISRDFFRNRFQQDSFSTERFTFARGPNAVLFGLGNPYGVFSTSSKRAQFNRNSYRIGARIDQRGSFRITGDANRIIVDDKLALRIAAVHDDAEYFQKPTGRNQNRLYGTVTYKPYENTTIRVHWEEGSIKRNPSRPWPLWDYLSPWMDTYQTNPTAGFVDGVMPAAPGKPLPPAVRRYTNGNRWISTEYTSGGTTTPTLNWRRSSISDRPSGKYGTVTGNDGKVSLLRNDLYPLDHAVTGYAIQRFEDYSNWSAFLEQQIGENLFIEAAYNHSNTDIFVDNGTVGIFYAVFVDTNNHLPNGDPNPNVGLLATDSPAGLLYNAYEDDNLRFTASYSYDFEGDFDGWLKYLGRHNIAAMWQRTVRESATQQKRLYNINSASPMGWSSRLFLRHYFEEGEYWMKNSAYGQAPVYSAGDTLPTFTDNTPFGAYMPADNPSVGHNRLLSRMIALQSFFWDDRVVFTYGTRKDMLTQYSGKGSDWNPFKDDNGLAPNGWEYSAKDFPHTRLDVADSNISKGVVFHATEWLSFFYNESTNFSEPSTQRNVYGEQLPTPGGNGKDYGIRFNINDNKIVGSLSYYEVNAVDGLDGSVRQGVHGKFSDRISNIWRTYGEYTGQEQYTQFPWVSGTNRWSDVSTHANSGYEFSLTLNPNKNWRITMNGSLQNDPELEDRGRYINQYLDEYIPFWRSLPADLLATPVDESDDEADSATVADEIDALERILANFNQLSSSPTSIQRSSKWKFNLIGNYTFDRDSRLGGFSLGSAVRVKGPSIIGFAFDDDGLMDGNNPFDGKTLIDVDGWIKYRTHILKSKIPLSIQLNIRNLPNANTLIDMKAADDGTGNPVIVRKKLQAPRTFILSATLSL